MIRPKFKDHYHIEHVPGEGYFLLSEAHTFVLEGEHLPHVVPLLDGRRTVDEIVQAASPFVATHDTIQVLDMLLRSGHLTESDPATPTALAAFWSEFNVDTRVTSRFLATCPVELQAVGDVNAAALASVLSTFGIPTTGPGTIKVAVTDDYLRPQLANINQGCLRRGMPLLLVKPVGTRLWIGPLIIPGKTSCWRCLEVRLRGNREVENYVERRTGKPGPFPIARARVGLTEYQAYAMAAVQLVRWLVTGSNPSLESRLLVADITSFSFGFHDVVKQPQCPDCGDPRLGIRAGQPVHISVNGSHNGASRESHGGVRSEPPELTFQRLQHHISPYTGIVNAVTPSMWHGAGPLRVYMAGHNFALKSDYLWFLKDGLRTHSSGKGRTDAQARTSALCEALERYSGVYRGDEIRVKSSFEQLGEDAIDPRRCMLFSERQYAEREKWLARRSRFQVVPLPFQEKDPIDWTPVWSLSAKRQRYLPTSYLFYNYPAPPQQFYCWADSNGAAAGITLDEAMLQGLLELVERDAVSLWWYNRANCPEVDLQAFDDGYIAEIQAFYKSKSREVWVLDITTDFGIPVCVAISRKTGGPTEDIMLGFGAHFDARIALMRALTELNQFIPALLNTAPDGRTVYVMGDGDAIEWWQTATLAKQPFLRPAEAARKGPQDYPDTPAVGAAAMLKRAIDILESKGHEVLVLDQTRPDIGLPVVKMLAPGLRHFWARFAPGRLYDVPVALGWRQTRAQEHELNPTPMFL
ncbi:MAG: TOMM precursor leader peptide-binding protein [Bryobacterales bacterium]|nr:TOMM precursor leader peptide-binding protein [Bryobacterales bacterium]